MSVLCDADSLALFQRMVGMRLLGIRARKYPGYLAYSEVLAAFDGGKVLLIDLREFLVAPKFEVFVINASVGDVPEPSSEWDAFDFGDFIVAEVNLLRRDEWIELPPNSEGTWQAVDPHGVQKVGAGRHSEAVDIGVCLRSSQGAELAIQADTFPLVLQLQYSVASSPVPPASKVAIV